MEKHDIDLCYRIRELRKAIPMNQAEFGKKIEVAQSYLTNIETAKRPVTDKIFKLICLQSWNGKFVNEHWLLTGEGDKFKNTLPESELANAISKVVEDINCESSIYTLVKEFLIKYEKLDTRSKIIIENFANDIINGIIEKKEG